MSDQVHIRKKQVLPIGSRQFAELAGAAEGGRSESNANEGAHLRG